MTQENPSVQGNKNEANYQAPVGQVNHNVEHMHT